MTTTTTRRQQLEAAVAQGRADAAAGADPFANIPNAGTPPTAVTPVPAAPVQASYFVAPDGNGDVALWRGTGTDDDNCQPVAYRYALDGMDTALWPVLVAALVEGGAR